jgi:hypothetical protein
MDEYLHKVYSENLTNQNLRDAQRNFWREKGFQTKEQTPIPQT